MRGKGLFFCVVVQINRITPAYAGKSTSRAAETHPAGGSPPPMRGKVTEVEDENGYKRITPAYAGKSFIFFFRISREQDHPRLCGEKLTKCSIV